MNNTTSSGMSIYLFEGMYNIIILVGSSVRRPALHTRVHRILSVEVKSFCIDFKHIVDTYNIYIYIFHKAFEK